MLIFVQIRNEWMVVNSPMKKASETVRTGIFASKTLLDAAPYETLFLAIFIVFQGLIPAISLFAIRSIIDWISASSAFPSFFVSLWAIMLIADIALSPLISVIRLRLNEKILAHCNLLLMGKANSIESLIPFEDAKIYDEIQFLKNEASRRPLNFVYILTGLLKDCVSLISVLALLATLEWWIPIALLIASLPHTLAMLWFEKQAWDQMLFSSPEARQANWLSSLVLNDRSAKEIRLFDFGSFLINRYKEIVMQMHRKISHHRWKQSLLYVCISAFTVAGNLAIISYILWGAKEGVFLIGSFVIAIQALVMTQMQLIGCAANLGMCSPCFLFFKKFNNFLQSNPCPFSNQNLYLASTPFQEISFNNVSFAYPDGRDALSHLNFSIKKGDRIAVVGENGAGKSTLVKLLLRFYDPSEGSITIDGKDLRSYNLKSWRETISAVFQDFGQYQFTVQDNIAFGNKGVTQKQISDAAEKGGFQATLERLPDQLNTLLGKEVNGSALSGGEWQKLAMSRAFLKPSEFIILDEPTAALDPHSEREVYKKFAENLDGKTALLITHRLGSIKMANRILVLKNGKLIEEGSHTDLINSQGEYSLLYRSQADLYETIK